MENQLFNFISIGKTLLENQSLWIYYFLPSASPALSPSHNKQYGENEKTIIALNAPATIQSELTGYLKPKFWIIAIVRFGKRKTEILYFWLVINWRLVVWMENYTMKPYGLITIRFYWRLLSVWHVPIRLASLLAFQTLSAPSNLDITSDQPSFSVAHTLLPRKCQPWMIANVSN